MIPIIQRIIPTQINPIVIKELRQSVRSRFVAGVFLLFMLVELFGVGIGLATSVNANNTTNYYAGRGIFHFLYIALSAVCILFIPAYAAIRLTLERWDNNLDLMYITTIKASAVIRGKLFATLAIAILLLSGAAPFMAFSYLLRGIDLPSIFIAIGFIFVFVTLLTQIMIFMACMPANRVFKIVLGLVALAGLFWAVVIANFTGWSIIYEGIGSKLSDPDFLISVAISLGCGLLGISLLQSFSVALISPPSSNRSLTVRIHSSITWLIIGAGIIATAVYYSDTDIILAWFVPSVIFFAINLIWGLGENPNLSRRVRRTIPRNPIMRRLAFLFYNGPAGALFWTSIFTLLSFVGFIVATKILNGKISTTDTTGLMAMATLFLYAVAYSLTALIIWRKLLFRRLRSSAIGIITCLLIAIGAILPAVVSLLMNSGQSWKSAWYVGNIFTIANENHIYTHITFAFCFASIMFIANIKWIFYQMHNFCRLEKTLAPTTDTRPPPLPQP